MTEDQIEALTELEAYCGELLDDSGPPLGADETELICTLVEHIVLQKVVLR